MMNQSWLRSLLMIAVLLCTLSLSSSAAKVGEDRTIRFLLDRKIEQVTYAINSPKTLSTVQEVDSSASVVPNSKYHGTRGSVQRQTRDVEDMLQEMTRKDPEEWTAAEWILMLLFLSFFGWIGCCLLSLCCCGRGSNILGWLCCYEICCRGGTDIDACCDYALS